MPEYHCSVGLVSKFHEPYANILAATTGQLEPVGGMNERTLVAGEYGIGQFALGAAGDHRVHAHSLVPVESW